MSQINTGSMMLEWCVNDPEGNYCHGCMLWDNLPKFCVGHIHFKVGCEGTALCHGARQEHSVDGGPIRTCFEPYCLKMLRSKSLRNSRHVLKLAEQFRGLGYWDLVGRERMLHRIDAVLDADGFPTLLIEKEARRLARQCIMNRVA